MFFEIITLLQYWVRKGFKTKLNAFLTCILLGILALICYGLYYVFSSTPFSVYVLDKLNLRRMTLPNMICDNCNNFSYAYIVENKDACANQDVFVLTFVTSFHANVEARNVMRRTWAGVKEYRGKTLKTIFMFGTHPDKNLNNQTLYEQRLHGDIVQANFSDTYFTLSNKSSMALRWVTEHCPQAKYILKCDDDSFNVPQRIVDYLLHVKDEKFVGGYCFTVMPDRRVSSKFYVSETTYPDEYYPTYCAGPGYIMSQGAVRDIVAVAPNVRFIQMEDVFVTGTCRIVAGLQYTEIPGMAMGRQQMTSCNMATWIKNGHNIVPGWTSMLWDKFKVADKEKDCVGRNVIIYACLLTFLILWFSFVLSLFRKA